MIFAILGRPVKARATRSAIMVASVPDVVNRIRSMDGIRSWINCERAYCRSGSGWQNVIPFSSCAVMAALILAFP